jgi:hypothetical protein
MIQIAVINESKVIQDKEIQEMLPAFAEQWNADLKSVWGIGDATMTFLTKDERPATDSWWLVFLDDSYQASALAYHDLTDSGLPLSKVFVKAAQADNSILSIRASHELCEMAVDPWLNRAHQDQDGVFWAVEVCDPVEDDQYAYNIGDVLVSDFVTPEWFAIDNSHGAVDFKRYANGSFEVLRGGYAQFFDPQKGWRQVMGNKAAQSMRADAPTGSRRERRARHFKTKISLLSARFI